MGLTGGRGGRGLSGDGDEADFALADEAELLAGGGFDVLVGVEVVLQRLEPLVARLKLLYLSAQAVFSLMQLVRADTAEGGGDEEIDDGENGDEQDDPAGRDTR